MFITLSTGEVIEVSEKTLFDEVVAAAANIKGDAYMNSAKL